MKLKDLLAKIGDEDQIIYLLLYDNWIGAFPAGCVPKEYEGYIVQSIMPENFEGESPLDGIVLKVWLIDDDVYRG